MASFGSADDVHAVKEAPGLFALQHAALNFLVDFTDLRSSTYLLILIHDVEEKWDDEVENLTWIFVAEQRKRKLALLRD
ncbi:hypothetical protein NC651_022941 [Populus alba x Populus x berolinensis]|nr:hypothetical protein NC651_022941 [Populus alba x Populus x berolinensis]